MASRAAPPVLLLLFFFLVMASLLAVDASAAAAAPGVNSPFVLAAARTQRKDPLDGLRYYTGGWNISSEHYWASVGFSAAPVFAAAGVWFAVFGAALFLAGIGCAVLYDGQGRFHGSTAATVDYVVKQSGDTVDNLRAFSGFLEAAKAAGVGAVSLPDDLKGRIDGVVRRVSSASDELAARTASNSAKIRDALDTVRKILIVLAAGMLILAFAGLGEQHCVLGVWIGVAGLRVGVPRVDSGCGNVRDVRHVPPPAQAVGEDHCPGLRRYSEQVYRGLLAVAAAGLLSVLLWVVHSRERRKRSDAREVELMAPPPPFRYPLEEKALLHSPRRRPYM
ncbi:hypothetical protein TRIUR3_12591 [Triticum urartu]|uniref:Uncharacterized protein n=2 Tax=Triticum TaxID=4564 RepID=A0A9R0XXM0_TRITD|nr:hypothetical protein TRIUR3_12591 [Triticum urartu]VAI44390.1 unnamed protein product [Triticum turgidum subsp. durum]